MPQNDGFDTTLVPNHNVYFTVLDLIFKISASKAIETITVCESSAICKSTISQKNVSNYKTVTLLSSPKYAKLHIDGITPLLTSPHINIM